MKFRLPYRGDPPCSHPEGHPCDPALVAADLRVDYGPGQPPALKGVSLRIETGTHILLVGPNGAGKSTLLKAAAGLLAPSAGSLRVFGCPALHSHPAVCYLPQRNHLDWSFPMEVFDLVLTGSYVHLGWGRLPGRAQKEAARAALERMDLAALAGRRIHELSGGQQQRALLARALVHDARLYLLDEPFNAVDARSLETLGRELGHLRAQGRTLLTSTHHAGHLPLEVDGILLLEDGQLVPSSPDHPEDPSSSRHPHPAPPATALPPGTTSPA